VTDHHFQWKCTTRGSAEVKQVRVLKYKIQ